MARNDEIVWTNKSVEPSYLLQGINPQRLLEKYSTTGIFELDSQGRNTNVELIKLDRIVGFDATCNRPTKWVKIHNGPKGAYIVPVFKFEPGNVYAPNIMPFAGEYVEIKTDDNQLFRGFVNCIEDVEDSENGIPNLDIIHTDQNPTGAVNIYQNEIRTIKKMPIPQAREMYDTFREILSEEESLEESNQENIDFDNLEHELDRFIEGVSGEYYLTPVSIYDEDQCTFDARNDLATYAGEFVRIRLKNGQSYRAFVTSVEGPADSDDEKTSSIDVINPDTSLNCIITIRDDELTGISVISPF